MNAYKNADPRCILSLQMAEHGAFQVLTDTYVTEESGTGVVHQAPYFGEVRTAPDSNPNSDRGGTIPEI